MTKKQSGKASETTTLTRRSVCKAGIVGSLLVPMAAIGQSPDRQRPQPGDQLVFEEGPHQGELVRPELLELNQQPVSALAREPGTSVLRDGSRLNRVMITRIDMEQLTSEFRTHAAAGVIAYSAVCTHTGCDVINWDAERLRMACPCHESQFDIYDGARVVGGPAPRPLAMLPLLIQDGVVTVAAEFHGRVGFTQQF
ncbi:MAG: Rieske (2Fe-2S) protein [Gammaproteobacteria bacterium]|nr:Rieske (2Fe-2S) protein [Gammaproteobacteria bacterium]